MNELAFDGSNPDAGLLIRINDLSRHAPGWVDSVVRVLGEYGLPAAVVALLAWSWWRPARRHAGDAPAAVAGVVWAGLSAVVALLLSVPIRQVVQRPRPFEEHPGLHVLLRGTSKYSFVNDHSTLAMAVGVGLFMVHRKAGLAGMGLAVLEGFARVFMGVDYPTDVIGGFALGTATALLLAPLAMLGLVPLARLVSRGAAARLVRVPLPAPPRAVSDDPPARPASHGPRCEKDLAA